MGIFIRNLGASEKNESNDPLGEHDYSININNRIICFFKHERKNKLSACLEQAAKTVKEKEKRDEEKLS